LNLRTLRELLAAVDLGEEIDPAVYECRGFRLTMTLTKNRAQLPIYQHLNESAFMVRRSVGSNKLHEKAAWEAL
jgi:hypothetical protein